MKRTLSFLFASIALVTQAGAWTHGKAPTGANTGGMLLNLSNATYFNGINPQLNWWTSGDSRITIVSTVNGTLVGQQIWDCPTSCSTPTTYLDSSTGELVTPVPSDVTSIERGWFATVPFPQYQYEGTAFAGFAGQVWKTTWTGCASPTLTNGGSLGTGGSLSVGSNTATITFGSSGFSNVTNKFTMTTACRADPPKNIKVYQNEYATNVAAGQFWNPDFISAIRPFAYVRLMDWLNTNASGISDSSQLAEATYQNFNKPLPLARGTGAISSSVLTITSWNQEQPFQVGQRIVCIGCTGTITISSLGTGTGGNGTYNLSGAGGVSLSGQVTLGVPTVGANGATGPKGGVGPLLACNLANTANVNVEYPIPAAATDQFMTDVATTFKSCLNTWLLVKFSFCNEDWNSGGAFNCYRYVQSYNNNTPAVVDYAGYRAAQLMEIAAGVFGTASWNSATNPTSRWIGAIGAQAASPAVATSAINGANAWISGGPSAYTLQQLFNQVDIAPYWGIFYDTAVITGVTAGATPTVTASNSYTNGQVIKVFVNGGTMASVLNGVYATVSNRTASNFQINIDTTGLTYGGTNNGAFDAAMFKLIDQSKVLNGSTPATYPTKFSYFAQQMSTAVLNGSATDASYGTITVASGLNLRPASGGAAVAGSLLDYFQQNALIAQKNGLVLSQYEGGPTWAFTGNAPSVIGSTANTGANEAIEFLTISLFDAGVVGDSTNTPSNMHTTMFSQFDSVNGIYPAQYDMAGNQTQFGPWGGLRFAPGDTGNLKWQAILAKSALGPYVDPTPAPTWSVNRDASDINFGSGGSTTLTCPIHVPSDGLAVIGVGWTNNTTTITSVSLSGGGGNMTQDAFTANTWSSAIYSKAVLASASPYTATITWSGSTSFRNCAAVTLTGLASGTKISASSGNPQKSANIAVTKGSFIFATATLSGAITFATSSTTGVATGTVTQIDKQVPDGQAFGFAYWSPGPSFSAAAFNVQTNSANSLAVATYK